MSATRTQIYLTPAQRAGLDRRAVVENKTMSHVIRDAIDVYLAHDLDADEREQLLDDTFGTSRGFGALVPLRNEWDRS